jgi:hypothetical protein
MARQNFLLADAGLEDSSMLPKENLSEQAEIDAARVLQNCAAAVLTV